MGRAAAASSPSLSASTLALSAAACLIGLSFSTSVFAKTSVLVNSINRQWVMLRAQGMTVGLGLRRRSSKVKFADTDGHKDLETVRYYTPEIYHTGYDQFEDDRSDLEPHDAPEL